VNNGEISRADVEECLASLVRCPSVSPGDPHEVVPPFGEAAMADLLETMLMAMGGAVERQDVLPGRPNVLARFTGSDATRTILLDAHTDTVSHEGMSISPFAAEIRNGRLYGRGACDTKGPMTSMLLALKAAVESGELACNVVFAATCDEESGAAGAQALVESGLKADFAIAAEPTELQLICRHKGVERANITLRGRAAHSSTPERGHNAIYPMVRLVGELERVAAEFAGGAMDAELGHPTLAVTTIRGGVTPNIIPEQCSIDVDLRVLPGQDTSALKQRIEALAEACGDAHPWCAPKVEWQQHYPPLAADTAHPDLERLASAITAEVGSCEHAAVAYGTNGGFYAAAGIPSVVFGPGSIADAHTKDESVDLDEVVTAARILRRFLCRA
jgi:acetylornithine deacetylase/succinyl-diaminopimelate desuccinylase family protein